MTKGYGVVDGGTEHERPGPNFGGHYVLVQWSCGLDCSEAAVIDIQDGTVLALPLPSANEHPHNFHIETGQGDLRNLRFKTDSYLLGIPNVADGKVHYYVLSGHTWKDLGSAYQQGIQATLTASKGLFGDPSLEVITFHLLNNTGTTVRTKPETWKLVIDGQEAPDPGGQLWTGGRPLSGYEELGPGETGQFGKSLPFSRYFPQARDYKVYWVAAGFTSNVVTVHGGTQR